ncbi:MAG: hypothetical protein M0009_15610 [Deltaproteobacteria bacterium]|nr:hypothetical protein [Deltaproteobacteria bacterium]
MVEKVFHDFVKGLCFYYERRDPREEALDLWFQAVKHLPDEPMDWISEQIRGRYETFPKNLPLVMRELWQQWLEDHPQRRSHRKTEEPCLDCDDTGLISLFRKGSSYLFRCGKCKRSNLNGVPMAYLADLEARGYSLTRQARTGGQGHG